MRIDTPTWIRIDHTMYQSVDIDLAIACGPGLLGDIPTLTVRALGLHATLLLELDRLMARTRFIGDWTARLWSVSPMPRFGLESNFIFGWRRNDRDTLVAAHITSWCQQVGQPIDAIQVTWACFAVPTVAHVIDLTAPDALPYTPLTRKAIQIGAQVLAMQSYQRGTAPPLRAAYDSEARTLYCLT